MSVNFYLVCDQCRKRIHIAQDGLSGWSFYSGEKDCMRKLGQWLDEHAIEMPGHAFMLHSEHIQSSQDYQEIDWDHHDRSPL